MTAPREKRPLKIHMADNGAHLVARLVRCLPAATFEMETLCRLAGVRTSYDVPTAAVECLRRPHMLINPDFAARYCQRDEHLFLLVMHELWHVILAHTRLYARMTPLHNIAFDAIINAGLSRQFPGPEFRGFFDELNPADAFPGLLLRPPPGWPDKPQYPPEDSVPPGTIEILKRLYPAGNTGYGADPLYEEILNLLRSAGLENIIYIMPVLLGDHDTPESERQALNNPVFREMMDKLMEKWPDMVMPGRGAGGSEHAHQTSIKSASEAARRAFANTLRRCLGPRPGRHQRKSRSLIPGAVGTGVLPNAHDRLVPARKLLGVQGVLWNQPGEVRARVPETPSVTHVYLDVSGSMAHVLPHLLGLILPYVRRGQAEVFQFSTIVEPMPVEELAKADLRTTGGTDINCVLAHAIDVPRLRRLLILTDGYTGVPHPQLVSRLTEQHVRVHAVLPAYGSIRDQLEGIAASIVVLPPLRNYRPS